MPGHPFVEHARHPDGTVEWILPGHPEHPHVVEHVEHPLADSTIAPRIKVRKVKRKSTKGKDKRDSESVPATPPAEVVTLPEPIEPSLAPAVAAVKLVESAAQAAESEDVGSASWATPKRVPHSPPFGRQSRSFVTCFRQDGCYAQCSHSLWVAVPLREVPISCSSCDDSASLAKCTDARCVTAVGKWTDSHLQIGSSAPQCCWSLCSQHGRAVALMGTLTSETKSKHRECLSLECWLEAAQDGTLPPSDAGVDS